MEVPRGSVAGGPWILFREKLLSAPGVQAEGTRLARVLPSPEDVAAGDAHRVCPPLCLHGRPVACLSWDGGAFHAQLHLGYARMPLRFVSSSSVNQPRVCCSLADAHSHWVFFLSHQSVDGQPRHRSLSRAFGVTNEVIPLLRLRALNVSFLGQSYVQGEVPTTSAVREALSAFVCNPERCVVIVRKGEGW